MKAPDQRRRWAGAFVVGGQQLGVSRPTLMKLVKDGAIPSRKVGTHTRLLSEDVLNAKKTRRARERAAFAALLDAEGDEI